MDQATETKLIQEAGAEMRRRGVPITPQKVAHFVAARTPPSVAEIDAALAGTGCVAVLNDLTGAVRVVKPPVLYTNLLPDELTALKKEKKDLEAILANPATPVIDRMRA